MSRSRLSIDAFFDGIIAGDRAVLAKAITLAESTVEVDRLYTESLLNKLLPYCGKSIRIGITGIPGVGKSTFIESLGTFLSQIGNKIAVLAIDPTSQKTQGSILADKTRMETLSKNPDVFIRPSASAQSLGGVAYHTREIILLCEAAGFNIVLVETVGVGQSETYVKSMVDFFMLLLIAGAGDELQGIKKGIMEMADVVLINKTDGQNVNRSLQAQIDAKNALHLQQSVLSGWNPDVLAISALENKGIRETWSAVEKFVELTKENGFFANQRSEQQKLWLYESIENEYRKLKSNDKFISKQQALLQEVMANRMMPGEAGRKFWAEMLAK